MRSFRLGFLLNPYAGVGGPAAFKGSDLADVRQLAESGALPLTAAARALVFLRGLQVPDDLALTLVTVRGPMGGDCLDTWDHAPVYWRRLVDYQPAQPSTAVDTERAAEAIAAQQVDLLVFVGGDGTARDLCRALGLQQTVLGVPAGVKMQSGVYAINPQAAAALVNELLVGDLVQLAEREVRDIDEAALRQGVVNSRYFGDMRVPEAERYVQAVKQGGLEMEELVLLDIAESLRESLSPDTLVIVGPGSTTHQVLSHWGLQGTLLGVDALRDGQLLAVDLDANGLQKLLDEHVGPVQLVVTAIGGQGHVLGRGNQQLRVDLLRRIGRDNLRIVATRTKLKTLNGRPLLMDSGDAQLDTAWQGLVPVETGYRDRVLYALAPHA